jgi:hypothetical protein
VTEQQRSDVTPFSFFAVMIPYALSSSSSLFLASLSLSIYRADESPTANNRYSIDWREPPNEWAKSNTHPAASAYATWKRLSGGCARNESTKEQCRAERITQAVCVAADPMLLLLLASNSQRPRRRLKLALAFIRVKSIASSAAHRVVEF